MVHSNDAQCRPVRLDQYVNQDPRLIFKARLVFKARPLISTTTLDPRPVFEARLVYKARLLFKEIRYVSTDNSVCLCCENYVDKNICLCVYCHYLSALVLLLVFECIFTIRIVSIVL